MKQSWQQKARAARNTLRALVGRLCPWPRRHWLVHGVGPQVVASRRVLAWSYVFKFYQFENESLERELQLFETYQVVRCQGRDRGRAFAAGGGLDQVPCTHRSLAPALL